MKLEQNCEIDNNEIIIKDINIVEDNIKAIQYLNTLITHDELFKNKRRLFS
ncbi:hypothetical protein [Campylobacter sputorum]|uniref:hypothetical protein n=1 Tax=Campylobacter sputorum TaxID=206 RepID=UPI000AAE3CBE|nr:hypothetical protein [Campylobacter sputorum]